MTNTLPQRTIALTNPTPIRVLVVDDQPVVCSGLAAFLSVYDDLTLVGEANDGAKAVNLCGQLRPDVALYLHQQALQARPCPRRQLPTLRSNRLRVMELCHDSLHTLLLLAQVHLGMGHLLFRDSLSLRDPAHRKRLEQFT